MTMRKWLRHEWIRAGLPLWKTNQACGVKNAATRKYFTGDHLWYFPPPDAFDALVRYANAHGKPTGYRNYHWQHLREAKGDSTVKHPVGVQPSPRKSDRIGDEPVADKGGNFGRFARTGLMDEYLGRAKQELLAGIRAEYWLSFFKIFQDQRDPATIRQEIERLRQGVESSGSHPSRIDAALMVLQGIEALMGST